MPEFPRNAPIAATLATTALAVLAFGQPADPPRPVRNDLPREGTELLVLRHQKFHKGGHDAYLRLSREGVWPWFEKIGSRIVGQWMVVHPDGSSADPAFDHGYRLARYASYEHWKATRQGHLLLGGNGPDYRRNREALSARNHYVADSSGAYFLEGMTATTQVYYMPALDETYEPAEAAPEGGTRPVRNDRNWPAREIIALTKWEVEKGAADGLLRGGAEGIWPYLEKVGARIVGQWQAVYPPESGFEESSEYDEVFLMVRYAGYEHWKAARPDQIVSMGGDGPDYVAYKAGLDELESVSQSQTVTFLEGYLYQSPPKFLPGLPEAYRHTARPSRR